MLYWILLVVVTASAFALGYFARRWHRPVGHVPDKSATLVMVAGGQPYVSMTVRSREPMDASTIAHILREMRTESGTGTP